MKKTVSHISAALSTALVISSCGAPAKSSDNEGFIRFQGETYEIGCQNSENNCSRTAIGAFSISSHNVTHEQWKVCVNDGVCPEISDPDSSDTSAVSVSWSDAATYIVWLNRTDSEKYSLPTLGQAEVYANSVHRESDTITFWISDCQMVQGSLLTRGYQCTEESCQICSLFRVDTHGVTSTVKYQDTKSRSETNIRLVKEE